MKYILILLLVIGASIYADDIIPTGIDWQRMTEVEKNTYVTGYLDGCLAFVSILIDAPDLSMESRRALSNHIFWGVTPRELKEAIEQFYMIQANLECPLYFVPYHAIGSEK